MKVTICELREDALESDWQALVAHVQSAGSDLVLLPEMPFAPWMFTVEHPAATTWDEAVAAHERWVERLFALAPAAVAGSRPVVAAGGRFNEGFIWTAHAGVQPARAKVYLPDEPGYWEASWYDRGERRFPPTPLTLDDGTSVQAGFLICTELWFMQHARDYGQAGVHLLLTPRATEARTVEKWLVGGRAAAIISGAYSLSSNKRGGVADAGGAASALGGQGWAIDPDGEVLALTSAEEPFVTVEVDLARAEAAKERYPRYVEG